MMSPRALSPGGLEAFSVVPGLSKGRWFKAALKGKKARERGKAKKSKMS